MLWPMFTILARNGYISEHVRSGSGGLRFSTGVCILVLFYIGLCHQQINDLLVCIIRHEDIQRQWIFVYFWVSFKSVLTVVASIDMLVLLLPTQQVGHEFGMTSVTIWPTLRYSFRMIWTDPSEIPSMLETSQVVFFFSVFKGNFLHSLHIFISLLTNGHSKRSATLAEITTLLNLENHPKTCLLPKATFNVCKFA
jgi:hypothetical protein